jgi:hypothetical protein
MGIGREAKSTSVRMFTTRIVLATGALAAPSKDGYAYRC